MIYPFTQPILTLKTRTETYVGSISDAVYEADRDNLVGLPGMRQEQRSQVVTFLAIMLHLTQKYAGEVRSDSLAKLTADLPPMPLYPDDGFGFLQTSKEGLTGTLWPAPWTEIIPVFAKVGHMVKLDGDSAVDDELLCYCLMAAGEQRMVKCNPTGPRFSNVSIYPSKDATIGSEIKVLATSYTNYGRANSGVYGNFREGVCLRDHLPFLNIKPALLTPQDVAWPYVDSFRPLRIARSGDKTTLVKSTTHDRYHILRALENHEPHVATRLKVSKTVPPRQRQRLGGPITFRDIQDFLFGRTVITVDKKGNRKYSKEIEPAYIAGVLSENDDYRYLRMCGTASKNGKTMGSRDLIVMLSGKVDPELSALMAAEANLSVKTAVSRIAGCLMHLAKDLKDPVIDLFNQVMDRKLIPWVLNVTPENQVSEIESFQRQCVVEAIAAFDKISADYATSGQLRLRTARTRNALNSALRAAFNIAVTPGQVSEQGNIDMQYSDASSPFVAQVLAMSRAIGSKESEIAKSIRSSVVSSAPGLGFFKLLVGLDVSEKTIVTKMPAYRAIAECLALVPHGKTSTLRNCFSKLSLSEDRIERLLEESGAALIQSVKDIAYMAKSSNLNDFDWRQLCALVLADAAANGDALNILKTKIAVAYCSATHAH